MKLLETQDGLWIKNALVGEHVRFRRFLVNESVDQEVEDSLRKVDLDLRKPLHKVFCFDLANLHLITLDECTLEWHQVLKLDVEAPEAFLDVADLGLAVHGLRDLFQNSICLIIPIDIDRR